MIGKFLKIGAAAAVVALSAWGALALNVDQTRIPQFREFGTQQVGYYRVTINFNDPNISTGQAFGRLRQNTFINRIACQVVTAFNAATTNVLTLGTTLASANELTGAAGVTPGTPAMYDITTAGTRGVSLTAAADVTLYAKYTQTGAAATTGQAVCVIEFIANNDN